MGRILVGISGWRYAGWRGVFYPPDLPQRRELEFASRELPTVEINGSFYSLQRAESWRSWRDAVPDDFVFAVKGAQFITHMKRLIDCRTPLANFFASGVLELGPKLGPVLWQFPERFAFDRERFAEFLALLPRTTTAAARLSREHDHRVQQPVISRPRRAVLRYALEIRHESFLVPEFVALLRRHNVALVFADTASTYCYAEDLTADFVYVRLHGSEAMYSGSYGDEALDGWAARARSWSRGREPRDRRCVVRARAPRVAGGRDVYVYFDNDQKVRAPFDARRLIGRLRGRRARDR
jgi:uncharacterized protein YecE (DUF72 family)